MAGDVASGLEPVTLAHLRGGHPRSARLSRHRAWMLARRDGRRGRFGLAHDDQAQVTVIQIPAKVILNRHDAVHERRSRPMIPAVDRRSARPGC